MEENENENVELIEEEKNDEVKEKESKKVSSIVQKKLTTNSSLLKAIGPILIKIGLVLLVIIMILGIAMFLVSMPGLAMENLKNAFNKIGDTIAAFYGADTTNQIEEKEIYEVLDYLEEMGYDIKGYGFLTDYIQSLSDVNDKNDDEDEKIDLSKAYIDYKQGVVRNSNREIIKAKSDYIATYIMSDNYVYTLKNDNLTTQANAKNWFEKALAAIGSVTHNISNFLISPVLDSIGLTDATMNAWGKGLIALYYDTGVVGVRDVPVNDETLWNWDSVKIDAQNKTMLIKKRSFLNNNDPMKFSLDGWTGRYGMPLEFLLSIHMSTMMPDLAVDMVKSFPTNVNIYLHSIKGSARTAYKINDKYYGYDQIGRAIYGDEYYSGMPIFTTDITQEKLDHLSEIGLNIGEKKLVRTEVHFAPFVQEYVVSMPDDDIIIRREEDNYIEYEFNDSSGYHYVIRKYIDENESGQKIERLEAVEFEHPGSLDSTIESIEDIYEYTGAEKLGKILDALLTRYDRDYAAYMPYIASVTNHWYRNVYFVLENDVDKDLEFVEFDYEYESIMKERWTLYETYVEEDGYPERLGMYKLYKVNEDGSYGALFNGTEEDAKDQKIKVQKKARTISAANEEELRNIGWNNENGIWTAYTVNKNESAGSYEPAFVEGEDDDIKKNVYTKVYSNQNVIQQGEAQRKETNEKIKNMFLNNKYFRYDGSPETAEIIKELREELKTKTGSENFYSSIPEEYMDITKEIKVNGKTGKYKISDYATTVSLNQDSLNAFSMLENTHTLDSDYIYRDFKELIVELGYFSKEELTDETPRLLQWLVPDTGSFGFPKRGLDKVENDFGTLIHSKGDLDSLEKDKLTELIKQEEEAVKNGTSDSKYVTGENKLEGYEEDEKLSVSKEKINNKPVGGINDFTSFSSANLKEVGSSDTTIPEVYSVPHAEPMRRNIQHVAVPEKEEEGYQDIIEDGNVEYIHYLQYKGTYKDNRYRGEGHTIASDGCGPTSVATLLSGYGIEATPADVAGWAQEDIGHRDGPGFQLEHYGIEYDTVMGSNREEYANALIEAFNEGKPVIALMPASTPNGFWTLNGHYVVLIGIDKDGRMITGDPASMEERRISCEHGIDDIVLYLCALWIPKEAPNGVKGKGEAYKGYIGNEAVVSPVTGLLLEYGTYDDNNIDSISGEKYRTNADYKYGRASFDDASVKEPPVDKVGYAKILVLNKELYTTLENSFRDDIKNIKGNDSSSLINEYGNYIEDILLYEDQLKDDKWTDKQKTIYGYKEFLQSYEKYGIDGHIVYIDGFAAEYPDENQEEDLKEGNFIPEGEKIEFDKTFTKINDSSFDDKGNYKSDEKLVSEYEQDDEYKLANLKETNRLNAESKVKNEALPAFYTGDKVSVKFGKDGKEVKYEGIFIKEGTVIGRTITDKELLESEKYRNSKYGEYDKIRVNSNGKMENNPNHVIGNYLRVIMLDKTHENIENVEDYMKLDDGLGEESKKLQEYQAWDGDLDILATAIHHECCAGEVKGKEKNPDEAEYVGYCMGYSVVNKVLKVNFEPFGKSYYDPNNTEWSPLYQVLTNKKSVWYGGATLAAVEAVHNGQIPADGAYCDDCLAAAEYCLKYDCTSVKKPIDYGSFDGDRFTINKGEEIPQQMIEQGQEGDGAQNSVGWCIVGFYDINQDKAFGKNDELFAIPKDMFPYWNR